MLTIDLVVRQITRKTRVQNDVSAADAPDVSDQAATSR